MLPTVTTEPAHDDPTLTHLTITGHCTTYGRVTIAANLTPAELATLADQLEPAVTRDLLTVEDVFAIDGLVNEAIDNYDGGNLERDVAERLVAAGWTAPECDDDVDAMAEVVEQAMPNRHTSHYWPADKLSRWITDDLVHVLVRRKVEVPA